MPVGGSAVSWQTMTWHETLLGFIRWPVLPQNVLWKSWGRGESHHRRIAFYGRVSQTLSAGPLPVLCFYFFCAPRGVWETLFYGTSGHYSSRGTKMCLFKAWHSLSLDTSRPDFFTSPKAQLICPPIRHKCKLHSSHIQACLKIQHCPFKGGWPTLEAYKKYCDMKMTL